MSDAVDQALSKYVPNAPDAVDQAIARYQTQPQQQAQKPNQSLDDKISTGMNGLGTGLLSPLTLATGGRVTLPKLQALAQVTQGIDPNEKVNQELMDQVTIPYRGLTINEPKWNDYSTAVKQNDATQARQADANPDLYYGSELVGGGISAVPALSGAYGVGKASVTSAPAKGLLKWGPAAYVAREAWKKTKGGE